MAIRIAAHTFIFQQYGFDQAKQAFVAAEEFYVQALQQVQAQEHQLKRRYQADEMQARKEAISKGVSTSLTIV